MMATSKPPSNSIPPKASSPRGVSCDDPLSSTLSSSLALIDLLNKSGLILAPAVPEVALVEAAARKINITPEQAKESFLIIAGFGETDFH